MDVVIKLMVARLIMYQEVIIIREVSLRRSKPDVEPVNLVEEVIYLQDAGRARVLTLTLYVGVVERRGTMLLTVVHPRQP